MNDILSTLNLVKIVVFVTFIVACISLKLEKQNKVLFAILLLNFCTEIATSVMVYNKKSIVFITTVSILLHHALWLYMLGMLWLNKATGYIPVALFLFFALTNLFFIEGFFAFNFKSFIFGALLYILIFLYYSYYNLQKENFPFFSSNSYLLLFCPVLFFLGFSFIFGFKNKALNSTLIFGTFKLYSFISIFVNLAYYSLINIYIYRNKRIQNVT